MWRGFVTFRGDSCSKNGWGPGSTKKQPMGRPPGKDQGITPITGTWGNTGWRSQSKSNSVAERHPQAHSSPDFWLRCQYQVELGVQLETDLGLRKGKGREGRGKKGKRQREIIQGHEKQILCLLWGRPLPLNGGPWTPPLKWVLQQ